MLKSFDPELHQLIEDEKERQLNSIELIASENFISNEVLECLGSCLTCKYSEGLPEKRFYGGCNIVDKIENLCIQRALEAFHLDSKKWGVNVQPYSGSPANLEAYNAILEPHDKILAMSLSSGSHLTHGHQVGDKKVSITAKFFDFKHYHIKSDGYIDYDQMEELAMEFKPKLIVCGYSAYSRDLDYQRFRNVCDKIGAYLLCDMSHFNGFVATGLLNNPFDFCDIVTTTTHKLLRGPRGAMIFAKTELIDKINSSVFPGCQGGPHQNQIAGLCYQLKMVASDEYKEYVEQVQKNAKILCKTLMEYGYKIMSDGTDNHLILLNVRDEGLTGSKIEKICEYVNITLNKNSIYGDKSAVTPGGVRIGSPWMTTRGCKEEEFIKIAEFIHRCIQISLRIQEKNGKMLKNFVMEFDDNEELQNLKQDVKEFMNKINNKK